MGKEKKNGKNEGKSNAAKSKAAGDVFLGGTGLEFNVFSHKFLGYLESLTCREMIEGEGPETSFDLPRPCVEGDEEEFVRRHIDAQIAGVKRTFRENIRQVRAADLPNVEKNKRILDLKLAHTSKTTDLENGRVKALNDLNIQLVNWEKQRQVFLKKKGDCIKAFWDHFGTAPMAICSKFLKKGEVRAAWNSLVKSYNSGVGGQQSVANIMHMLYMFNTANYGTISEAIEAIRTISEEIANGGRCIDDSLLLEFFLGGIEKSGNTSFNDIIRDIRKESPTFAEAELLLYEREATLLVKKQSEDFNKDSNSSLNESASNELYSLLCHAVKSGKFPGFKSAVKAKKNSKEAALVVCQHCKKPGHSSEQCFTQKICKKCQKKGHIAKYCKEKSDSGESKQFNVCATSEVDVVVKNDHAAATPPEFYCVLCDGQVTHKGCSIEYEGVGSHDPDEIIEGNVLESIFAHTATCISEEEKFCFVSLKRGCHFYLRIIIDSGASGHMLPCRCLFVKDSVRTVQGKVSLGKSDYKLPIVGKGNTHIEVLDSVLLVPDLSFGLISLSQFDLKGFKSEIGNGKVIVRDRDGRPVLTGTLEGSLYYLDEIYMERLRSGFLSCFELCESCERANLVESIALDSSMDVDEEVISEGVRAALSAGVDNDVVDLVGSAHRRPSSVTAGLEPIDILHRWWGHLGVGNIKKALKHNMVVGAKYSYDNIKNAQLKFCPTCMEGRMKAFSSRKEFRTREYDLFEKVAMDYKGKILGGPANGYNGFYLVSDYGSNFVFAYPVKSKGEEVVLKILEKLKSAVGQCGKSIKVFQSDSDTVLLGGAVTDWLRENNIHQQISAPRTHWQNGFIESNMGKVMDRARTLMADGQVPLKYWVYAVLCACYLINRSPFGESDKTPYEIRFGLKPDISHLVPFFSVGVYSMTKEERNGPFDYKARRCRMLGYDERAKNSYYVLDLKTGSVLTRHDCIFDETLLEFVGQDNLNGELESDDLEIIERENSEAIKEIESSSDNRYRDEEEYPYWDPSELQNEFGAANVLLEGWIEDVKALLSSNNAVKSGYKDLKKLPVVTNVTSALNGPDGHLWKAAMEKEWKAFEDRGVFKPAPQEGRAMKTKLILKAMYDNDYSIKYKARLVACGYSQVKGVDYDETYAPTTSTVVIFIAIQVGAMYGMDFSSFDVTAAFLEGKNDFQNFAKLPKEFGGLRVEVIGNFYGEKQGPKIWNDLLHAILILFGFERCPVQPCLYRYFDKLGFIIVVVHVDDGLMIFNCQTYRDNFMAFFATKVQKVTMKENVQKYVGMDFSFDSENRKVKLSHHLYISQNYGEHKGKFGTPMAATTNLRVAKPNPANAAILNETGKLRFICDRARSDLLVVTGELATGGDKSPSDEHLKTVERVKHYLNRTIDFGLTLGGLGKVCVFGYSDAAYITDGNCKSRLGGCLFLNADSGAVRSFSKNDTQPSSLSHSSTEAEIKAIDEFIREAIHIMDIYSFLCGPYREPIKLFVDNLSAIELCESLKQSHRVKHINLRIHFVREMIEAGFIELHFVPTDFNVADVLTKPLAEEKFTAFCDVLMSGHGGVVPGEFVEEVHCALTAESFVGCDVCEEESD